MTIRERLAGFARKSPPLFDFTKTMVRRLGLVTPPLYERVRDFARGRDHVNFLQIGSNDGISNDPLREFIAGSKKWRGCLVEPLPHVFEHLKNNYAYLHRADLHFKNSAVSDHSGSLSLYRIGSRFHRDFDCQPDQLASFDPAHIVSFFHARTDVAEKIEGVEIEAVDLRELIEEVTRSVGPLDLIHMDVEGHEHELLSRMPFETCRPDLLIFENQHLKNPAETYALLESNGYSITEYAGDAVAERIR